MKRILITGMSGTGKSTVIRELAALGHKAIDSDLDGWSEYVAVPATADSPSGQNWVWREDRVAELLATDDADVLFISGCASNQVKFYPQFDHIVLFSAPPEVMTMRIATRTDNPYGKAFGELAEALANKETYEPMLRRSATVEIDTTIPVDQVVAAVLQLV